MDNDYATAGSLAMSPDNKHLYATSYNDAVIVHWDTHFAPMCGSGTYISSTPRIGTHCVLCGHELPYPGNGNIYGCGKYSGQGRTGSTCDGTGHTGKTTTTCYYYEPYEDEPYYYV